MRKVTPHNICCIGGDRFGGTTCCVIAYRRPEIRITVLDKKEVIDQWKYNKLPFHQPGLDQIMLKCRNRNLFFSTDYVSTIRDASAIFLSNNIPKEEKTIGGADSNLEEVTKLIALHSETNKIVIENSVTPLSSVERISTMLNTLYQTDVCFEVLSNSIFLNEGSTLEELVNPSLVIIGCQNNPKSRGAAECLSGIYEPWMTREKVILISYGSAEICKLALNAFLAQNISSINSLAEICQKTNAKTPLLTDILSRDTRMGSMYMKPSLEFGRFHEEVLGLVSICDSLGFPEVSDYWRSVLKLNDYQKESFLQKIISILGTPKDKEIAVWGYCNKKTSFNIDNSPAVDICKWLASEEARVRIYDPGTPASQILQDLNLMNTEESKRNVQIYTNVYEASKNTSAIIVCSDWDEFSKLDFSKVAKEMQTPLLIDGKKFLKEDSLKSHGFNFHSIS